MDKKIRLFVKGKMGCGKTTFINTLRDILKKNKKFKALFDGYVFDIYEFCEYNDGEEKQAASTKIWTITSEQLTETEELVVHYKKSIFVEIFLFIKNLIKKIIHIF